MKIKPNRNRKIRFREYLLILPVIFWFFLLILIPFYGILDAVIKNSLDQIVASLSTSTALHAFFLTGVICLIVSIINTIFGVILAYVLSRQEFKGKLFLESLLDLPFAVSPVVIGFMLIILFGINGWIGKILYRFDIKIIYALPGMVIATLFVTLPFVAKEVIPILRQFSSESEEAAKVLGASRRQTFWKIVLPTIKWGLGYGITLTIARSIGEFGAVLVVSGNILNQTQSATLYIHDQFTDLNYCGAYSASIILMILSVFSICLIQLIYKKRRIK